MSKTCTKEITTIKTEPKVLKEESLIKGITDCIIVDKYYDLHGTLIKTKPENFNFAQYVSFEIVEKTIELHFFNDPEPFENVVWELKISGRIKDVNAEITAYSFDPKTKILKLRACEGAG